MNNCTEKNTIYLHPVTQKCVCYEKYYGQICDLELNIINIGVGYTIKSLDTILALITSLWIVIYLVGKSRISKNMYNIGTASNILNLVGSILELTMTWISTPVSTNLISLIMYLIFFYIPILLLLSSTAFIVGFWVDVLGDKKISFTIRNRTKIFIIINAIIGFLMAVVGGVVGLTTKISIISIILIVFPLISTIILIIVLSTKVVFFKNELLSFQNSLKQKRAKNIGIVLIFFWLLYMITLFIQLYLASLGAEQYIVILNFLYVMCKRIISLSLIIFFDNSGKVFKSILGGNTIINSEKTISSKSFSKDSINTQKNITYSISSPNNSEASI